VILCFIVLSLPTGVRGQQKCPLAPVLSVPSGSNMFSPEREMDLGDLMAEQTEGRYGVIRGKELTAYMERVAGRLLDQLPPTGLHIQVILFDAPVLDAFSMPGGRIYVSRKLVSFLRDEDELASVLGHELGHIVTHQPAIDMTFLFRQVLKAGEISSREDLLAKYNQLLDNQARGTQAYRQLARQEEPDQYVADQVALYAEANAGYPPHTFLDFFDRLTQTHGKTGGFFSNWFGLTTPNEKRLGQMQKAFADMPAGCGAKSASAASTEFQVWQTAVIGYSRASPTESLPGLVTKLSLNPPLRGDITRVRFSPDGQYALAQDEASIFVLTRVPFAFRFRIDAPDSRPASFTADSKDIIFSTPGLRVEEWNIAGQKRTAVHEMTIQDSCVHTQLSPDGKTLACFVERKTESPPYFDVEVFDVATGGAVFVKKHFVETSWIGALFLYLFEAREGVPFDPASIAFSPDSHHVVVTALGSALAVDLTTKFQVPLRGPLKDMLKANFTFLSSDRIIVENTENPVKSAVFNFPSGEKAVSLPIGDQGLEASAQGTYAFLRPIKNAQVGVLDVKTGQGVMALTEISAIDIYNGVYITQSTTGEIALFNLGEKNFAAKMDLPMGPLGSLRTRAVSPDLHWLAVSGSTRGAVWDLNEMKRLYFVHGFRGAFFDGGNGLYFDIPKRDPNPRTIIRADLAMTDLKAGISIADDATDRQYGRYLISRKPNGKDKSLFSNVKLQVADVRDGKSLWEINFPKSMPGTTVAPREDRMILDWTFTSSEDRESLKEEVKRNPALEKQIAGIKGGEGVHLFEVLEAGTGAFRGAVLVDTARNSYRIDDVAASGNLLLLTDDDNRTRVYSVSDGELLGTFFGSSPVVSPAGDLVGVQNERGGLQFYQLPSLKRAAQLSFSGAIAMNTFSADGARFLVLTDDQNIYRFDSAALTKTEPSATPTN
jgi:WD40 repeat protein